MDEMVTRRWLLGGTGAAGLALVAAACAGSSDKTTAPTSVSPDTLALSSADAALGAGSFALFTQSDLNFQTLFALGGAGINAEVGEVVTVVDQANAATGGVTYQSLFDAMVAMGNTVEQLAVTAADKGHQVTARNQFLRAAQYYNQALYWVLGTDRPGDEGTVYTTMNNAFIEAAKRMDPVWEPVAIPYESSSLNAWFLKPKGASGRLPTMIINNGSDAQNIDLVSTGAKQGLERGYNVLIFEGPGQGNQLFLNNVVFRPDWEKVITPVVDYLHTRDDVATDKIAIRGISFGGELVPRAAAFEPRLAAVIADPGDTNIYLAYPSVITDIAKAGTPEEVNSAWADILPELTAEESFNLKKRLEIYTQGAHDDAVQGKVPTDWYAVSRAIQTYNNTDVVGQITAPTLVLGYEGDTNFGDGPQTLFAALKTAKKDLVIFTKAEGAQYHCGPMAPQRVSETVYDWLDEVLGR